MEVPTHKEFPTRCRTQIPKEMLAYVRGEGVGSTEGRLLGARRTWLNLSSGGSPHSVERKRRAPATCPHTECGIEKEEVRATSTESHFLRGKTECVCVYSYICVFM